MGNHSSRHQIQSNPTTKPSHVNRNSNSHHHPLKAITTATMAAMDANTQTKRASQDAGARRPSGEKFSKITSMKRDPANDRAAARRASFEEQTIPKGAGVLGDMWNKFIRG